MSKQAWTHDDIPDQSGKLAIVTGANSGIGLETARYLAARGARVILACRSESKARAAMQDIHSTHADAEYIFFPFSKSRGLESFAAASARSP